MISKRMVDHSRSHGILTPDSPPTMDFLCRMSPGPAFRVDLLQGARPVVEPLSDASSLTAGCIWLRASARTSFPILPLPLVFLFGGGGAFAKNLFRDCDGLSGPVMRDTARLSLRVGSWQNGFFADFYFWAAGFFRGFSRRIFSPHFCGKKCPEKSSRKIPGKILQNLYNRNPRHISAEGAGQYLSDTPLLRAMGFFGVSTCQLGAIPPPLFQSITPLERACDVEVRYPPPLKRGISAILARYPMKTRQMGAIPPCAIQSQKGIARYGGVSRTGPLRWRPAWATRPEIPEKF